MIISAYNFLSMTLAAKTYLTELAVAREKRKGDCYKK